ncbi:MAG: polysaccharide biosynthesis/export family protein [Sedimentisphaerales bacterium]|nr:polysaccharide biosynthesis/export family protein [Sedimentisphaerales bacterium]
MKFQQTRKQVVFLFGLMLVTYLTGCRGPDMVGRFRATPVTNIILDDLGVVDEEPDVFAGARAVEPRDMLADESEYIIGPGDVLDISIFELFNENVEWMGRKQVSETGRLTIPVIGTFRAAGQTELELADTIVEMLSPQFIKDPTVSVVVTGPRKKRFSISGAVQAPGSYQLSESDLRISRAMADAGGIPQANADYAYVIRTVKMSGIGEGGQKPGEDVVGASAWKIPGEESGREVETGFSAEPVKIEAEPLEGIQKLEKAGQSEPAKENTEELNEEAEEELLKSIEPLSVISYQMDAPGMVTRKTTVSEAGWGEETGTIIESLSAAQVLEEADFEVVPEEAEGGGSEKSLRAVRKNDRFYLVPAEGGELEEGEPEPESFEPPRELPTAPGVGSDWTDDGLSGQIQEVIEVDLKKLRGGDWRQNMVIRAGDEIQIPFNATGIFYVMGQVARPGPYSLAGEKLTLRQSIASAGPMTPLAWPSRCEITRRVGENREVTYRVNLEKLFAGTAPDVFLKPHDIINVGSHPVARWMAVIRQSFRTTYGFGFVYDRNFADKDFGH